MPYLNWTEEKLKITRGPHADHETLCVLELSVDQVKALREALGPILLSENSERREGQELRLDLPRGSLETANEQWTIFWKLREGESRLLLAHPEKDEWVATVVLSEDHAKALMTALEQLESLEDRSVALSQIGRVARLGNLELVIRQQP